MSDCSTNAWKTADEFPGVKRLKVYWTDPDEREFDWPFVAVGREVERIELDGVAYVDGERMLAANGRLCDEVNRLVDQTRALMADNARLRYLVQTMRRDMVPFERDAFSIGWIDKEIAELGIEVDK